MFYSTTASMFMGSGVEFGPNALSEAQWRTQFNIDRNGDIYPTHGAGPVMHYANINQGQPVYQPGIVRLQSKGIDRLCGGNSARQSKCEDQL